MEFKFSDNIKNQESNAIREIFKALKNKEIISFAGGFPSKENIPNKEIAKIAYSLLESDIGKDLMQYGATEGYLELKNSLINFVKRFDIENIDENNILITSGAQQSIDLISKAMINRGDVILTQKTTYLAAILIFKSYGAQVIGVDFDGQNIDLEDLKEKAKKYKPKFLYLIPTFSNPNGFEMDKNNRKEILNIAKDEDFLIVEDDPYSELRYEKEKIQSIKSLDKDERCLFISSFSKTICPGLRTAYSIGNFDLIRKMTILKQSNDVYSSYLNQAIVNEYIKTERYEKRLLELKKEYSKKRDLMIKSINKYMPKSFKYIKPNGGLFIYGYFLDEINVDELFKISLKNNVVFISIKPFSTDGKINNAIRLNFSNSTLENIEEGIKRLANSIKELKGEI